MTRRDIEVKRCCSCKFGKRVRMDINYEYPIQYICSLTSSRVYTTCYDYPPPEWCPYKLLADLCDTEGKYADLSNAHKAYYKRMIEENIKLQARLESQSKSLVEMVKSGELQPPQEINMCPFV